MPELLDEPELRPELKLFLEGFFFLNLRRPVYLDSVGGIPLVEIEAYCRLFDVWDPGYFAEMVSFLDGVFLQYMRDKRKANAEVKPDPKKPRAPKPGPKPRR